MTVGNVLATTLRVWGRNLPRFLLLAVVCYLPIAGWYLLLRIDAVEGLVNRLLDLPLFRRHPTLYPEAVGLGWIPIAVFASAIAVCTVAAMRGERASIWRGLAVALRRLPTLIAIALLVRLATVGTSLAIQTALWDDRRPYDNPNSDYFWMCVFAAVWIVTTSLFIATIPAATLERRGPISAIARGFALARASWIKILAIGLVEYVLVFGVYYTVSWFMIPWVMEAGPDGVQSRFAYYAALRFALNILLLPLAAILAAVIYERLREAKEGPAPNQLDRVFD